MKNILALVLVSLLAFTCTALPPGSNPCSTKIENFELQDASCLATDQVAILINCNDAVLVDCQKIEIAILSHSNQVIKTNCVTDAGIMNCVEISPFPAEIAPDLWRHVVSKFKYASTNYGHFKRSNSLPPNLS